MTTVEARPATRPTGHRSPTRRTASGQRFRPGRLTYLTLLAVLFFSAFPLYFSVVVASQDNSALGRVPPPIIPGANLIENTRRVFDTVPFGMALLNSFIAAAVITASVVLFSTLAGFAFAKLRFRAKSTFLLLVVATMMVPTQLGIIPLYILVADLGWGGKLQAVILPALVSAFSVFWMRQAVEENVPTELIDAARADGCSLIRVYWHVVVPAIRPAAAVLGVFMFMGAWNDFFWPLVVLGPENPTVPVALSTLASGYFTDYSLVLAGATLAVLPVLAIFILLAKQIVGGIMQGAVKG
jgi:cellobiose transport system permease protein